MLNLPYTFKFYFFNQPIDMRKTFNGLHLLIMSDVEAKDFPGRMYIFLNKRINTTESKTIFFFELHI